MYVPDFEIGQDARGNDTPFDTLFYQHLHTMEYISGFLSPAERRCTQTSNLFYNKCSSTGCTEGSTVLHASSHVSDATHTSCFTLSAVRSSSTPFLLLTLVFSSDTLGQDAPLGVTPEKWERVLRSARDRKAEDDRLSPSPKHPPSHVAAVTLQVGTTTKN